jgi:hypothetical protein
MSAVKSLCNSLLHKGEGTAGGLLAKSVTVPPATLEQPLQEDPRLSTEQHLRQSR